MAEVQQIRELPSKLAFYQPEYIQDTVESGYTEEYTPIGYQATNPTDPVTFFIPGSEDFIDLEKSYFEIVGTFIGKDGPGDSAKTAYEVDNMSIVNNFFHSLFSSIHVNVNNSAVTFSNDNYAYLAYIHNLINYPYDFQRVNGDLYLWSKDTSGRMDVFVKNGGNTGSDARKKWITDKNEIRGIMKLRTPLFLMHPYLLSFLNVQIVLNRVTNPAFYIKGPAGNTFNFRIDKMLFHVRKVKVLSVYVEGIENMMHKEKENVVYPLKDSRVIAKTYPGFGTEIIEDNLFHGILPERIGIAVVDNDAFAGKRDKNPFNFKHKNIEEIGIFVNGVATPRNMIAMHFDDNDYHTIYYQMLDSFQAANPGNINCVDISKDEFGNGFTFFSFDMSPDQYGRGLNHQTLYNQPASIRLKIKFKSGTISEPLTILIYYETASRLIVDSSRQVQVFTK